MEYYWAIGKERSTITCHNVNEPQKHYAECKKPVTEDYMLYGCIYMVHPE